MDDEEWVTCPYQRSHRVPRSRIQAHLVKCEPRHAPLAVCPYNATHRMPEAQLTAHVKECPARAAMCASLRPERALAALTTPHPTVRREYMRQDDPDNEEWDD